MRYNKCNYGVIMPRFGQRSLKNLKEAHPDLQKLFHKVIEKYDCSIIEGYRSQIEQDVAFHSNRSKVKYPNSKHNQQPSMAVDVCPYHNGIDWNDREKFVHFAGYVKGVADTLNIDIRWGGDWDSDNLFNDQSFHDLPHFELVASSTKDQLPDGPTEDDINVTLEDIENEAML